MFIPYRVDVPFNHQPVVNWIVVTVVVLVFIFQAVEFSDYATPYEMTETQFNRYLENATAPQFILDGWGIKGLFGHMWLHAGLLHLIGNLIFLWLFGNAVCSKIGNLLYLPVYILCGLAAAIMHLLFFDVRMLGASGAINGMVGMYLVFFLEKDISCFFFFYFRPYWFTVRSFWMVLLWFAFDILGALYGGGGVAYMAHLGGFGAGFAMAVLLLRTKVVTMEEDEKSLFELVGLEKDDDTPAAPERRGDFAYWQQEWGDEHSSDQGQEAPAVPEIEQEQGPYPHAGLFEVRQPAQRYIRFVCRCGQKVKIAGRYAGLTGRCPKCSARLVIPGQPEDFDGPHLKNPPKA